DENQAMRVRDEFFEIGMEIERFNGGLKGRKQADGEADAARALQNVDATANAGNGAGKVRGTAFEKLRPLLAENFVREAGENLRCDGFAGGVQGAANAERGGEAGFEVQIAGTLLFGAGNQGFEGHTGV